MIVGRDEKPLAVSIIICVGCGMPNVLAGPRQEPKLPAGYLIEGLKGDLLDLYEEARNALAAGCPNGCVLICRTILMHLCIKVGAKKNLKFEGYVDFLRRKFRHSDGLAECIRFWGNKAAHKLPVAQGVGDMVLEQTDVLIRWVLDLERNWVLR